MIRWLVCTHQERSADHWWSPSKDNIPLGNSLKGSIHVYGRIAWHRHPGGVRKPHLSARRITHQDHAANPMKSFEIWPCGAWRHNSQKHLHNMADSVIFRWWYHTSHQNMAAAFVVTKSRLHEINYRPRRVNEKQINFCMRQNMTKIMKNNEIMKIVMRDHSIWRGRATVI